MTQQKIVAIVQARIGSTRLPGKILSDIFGKPMLWHVVNRIKHSKFINDVLVATTTLVEDDQTVEFCLSNNINYYRGSSDDVLSRYYEAAKLINADIIIRITSDCPLIDPIIIDDMLNQFINEQNLDYFSNVLERTFPRGLDTEIFTFSVLEKAHKNAVEQFEREHVTPFMFNHDKEFKVKNFSNTIDYSYYRWTVDTHEDLELIREIYKSLNHEKLFLFNDVLALLERKPELKLINRNVQQKKIGE